MAKHLIFDKNLDFLFEIFEFIGGILHISFRLSCDFKTCNSDHFGKFGQKRFLKKIRTQKSEYKFDKHGLIIIPFPHGINSYTDSRMSDGNISYITMLMDVKGCVC